MMNASAPLDEAYLRLHRTGPEFGGDRDGNNGLANHGPMAAEVLVRRGHGERVTPWLDDYVTRLIELPSSREPINEQNLHDALGGGRARVGDWAEYFTREMAEHPIRRSPASPTSPTSPESSPAGSPGWPTYPAGPPPRPPCALRRTPTTCRAFWTS